MNFLADLIAGIFVLPSIVHNILSKIDYEASTILNSTDVPRVFEIDETYVASARFFGVMSILSTITAVYR